MVLAFPEDDVEVVSCESALFAWLETVVTTMLVATCAIVKAALEQQESRENGSNDGRNSRLIEDILREEASTLGQEPG